MILHKLFFFLLLIAPILAGAQPDDQTSTRTLVLAVQDFAGEPLEGVTVSVNSNSAPEREAVSGMTGIIRVPLFDDESPETLSILVRRENLQLGAPIDFRNSRRNLFAFARMIPSDTSRMTLAERSAYLSMMPMVYGPKFFDSKNGDEVTRLHPARIAPLIEGFGQELPQTMDEILSNREEQMASALRVAAEGEDWQARKPALRIRVRTPEGRPAPQSRVLLFTPAEQPGARKLVASQSADVRGEVIFYDLQGETLYRAVALSQNPNQFAPSSIIRLSGDDVPREGSAAGARTIELVLRERSRNLTGFVFYGNGPAPGVRIRTNGENQPLVESATDEFGFFELAPLRPGDAQVQVTAPGGGQPINFMLNTGEQETLIPIQEFIRE